MRAKERNLLGWASWLPTTAAMLGFLLSPTGGWVTSAPRKITWEIATCQHQGVIHTCIWYVVFSTHWLVENFWSDGWNKDRIHSSQFHIDLGLTILNHADEAIIGIITVTIKQISEHLPSDTSWRVSGVKSCSHFWPEKKYWWWKERKQHPSSILIKIERNIFIGLVCVFQRSILMIHSQKSERFLLTNLWDLAFAWVEWKGIKIIMECYSRELKDDEWPEHTVLPFPELYLLHVWPGSKRL